MIVVSTIYTLFLNGILYLAFQPLEEYSNAEHKPAFDHRDIA
jgi:hypothetical protein